MQVTRDQALLDTCPEVFEEAAAAGNYVQSSVAKVKTRLQETNLCSTLCRSNTTW